MTGFCRHHKFTTPYFFFFKNTNITTFLCRQPKLSVQLTVKQVLTAWTGGGGRIWWKIDLHNNCGDKGHIFSPFKSLERIGVDEELCPVANQDKSMEESSVEKSIYWPAHQPYSFIIQLWDRTVDIFYCCHRRNTHEYIDIRGTFEEIHTGCIGHSCCVYNVDI